MKKVTVFLAAVFAVIMFAGLTTVHAYPFIEVEAFVNPYVGTITDNLDDTTTFSEVTYTFNVYDSLAGGEMNAISLEFENDVFESFGSVIFTLPTDWTYDTGSSTGSVYLYGGESVACPTCVGTPIGLGESLEVTLQDVVVYNEALVPGNKLWQEATNGDIWNQSFFGFDTNGGGDGGSTSVVPEPGTLLLFGSGLVGLFYVRRTKTFNI